MQRLSFCSFLMKLRCFRKSVLKITVSISIYFCLLNHAVLQTNSYISLCFSLCSFCFICPCMRGLTISPKCYFSTHHVHNYDIQKISLLFQIVMDLIDYTPEPTDEDVTVYDTRKTSIRDTTTHWKIDDDAMDFPIVSQFSVITVRWTVNTASTGRLTFVLRSSTNLFLFRYT